MAEPDNIQPFTRHIKHLSFDRIKNVDKKLTLKCPVSSFTDFDICGPHEKHSLGKSDSFCFITAFGHKETGGKNGASTQHPLNTSVQVFTSFLLSLSFSIRSAQTERTVDVFLSEISSWSLCSGCSNTICCYRYVCTGVCVCVAALTHACTIFTVSLYFLSVCACRSW